MLLLYNSKGDFIAFKKENYLYDVDGRWIGFSIQDDNIVYDTKGIYLGTIVNNRLYKEFSLEKYFTNQLVKFPGYPKMFSFPKPIEKDKLPDGFGDVKIKIPLL